MAVIKEALIRTICEYEHKYHNSSAVTVTFENLKMLFFLPYKLKRHRALHVMLLESESM